MPQKAEGTPARTSRVYRFRDLKGAGVSYTRKHITDLEKRGEFPMHFQLGPNSIGWVAEEVDNWVEERIRRRVVPPRQVLRGNDPGVHNAVFRNRDLREPLAVPIRELPAGGPDWEQAAADMLAAIASPTDPAETATNGCAKRDNHDALQQMRQVDRSVWAAGEHRPADRDRELRKQPNE